MRILNIILYFSSFVVLFIFVGCNRFIFQPNGTVISGRDDFYINDSLRLCLQVPGDFKNYQSKNNTGARVDHLYPGDKKILHALGLKKTHTSVLFSVVPVISPFYHFVVVLRDSADVNVKNYNYRNIFDTAKFYYRKPYLKNLEVEETLIPYKNQFVEFIYYNNKLNDCSYCDIEQITNKNSIRILKGIAFDYSQNLSECDAADKSEKNLKINIPQEKLLKDKGGLIIVEKLDNIRNEKEFETFKILKPAESTISLTVCKGSYSIIYMDLTHHPIWNLQKDVN